MMMISLDKQVPEGESERGCVEQSRLGRDLSSDLEARLVCQCVARQLLRQPRHGLDHGGDQTRDRDPGPRHELLLHAGRQGSCG